MNWKEFGVNERGLIEVLTQNLPVRTEENQGETSFSGCPSRDSNRAPLEPTCSAPSRKEHVVNSLT
jgi:hypothetical protein